MQFIDENIYKDKIGIYGIKNLITNKIYVGQTGESFKKDIGIIDGNFKTINMITNIYNMLGTNMEKIISVI